VIIFAPPGRNCNFIESIAGRKDTGGGERAAWARGSEGAWGKILRPPRHSPEDEDGSSRAALGSEAISGPVKTIRMSSHKNTEEFLDLGFWIASEI
jgi:hypothetical protein